MGRKSQKIGGIKKREGKKREKVELPYKLRSTQGKIGVWRGAKRKIKSEQERGKMSAFR